MKELNRWMIGLNFLGGTAIFFILLLVPPYLTAYLDQSTNEPLPQLKAQEINPWIDVSIPELNNLTLREVFEYGNIDNYDFSNGTTNFSSFAGNLVNEDNNLIMSGIGTSTSANFFDVTGRIVDRYYYNFIKFKILNVVPDNVTLIPANGSNRYPLNNIELDTFYTLSGIGQARNNAPATIYLPMKYDFTNQTIPLLLVDFVYSIDLTTLGIDNLSQEQMDYYYNRYVRYKDSTINDYTTVFTNYLSLAPDSNPLEVVKPIEYWLEIITDTYATISNFWNNVSNLFVVDIIAENAFEIYDKWWFKPFQWLIGD